MSRQAKGAARWMLAAALVLSIGILGGCKKSPYDKEPEADSTGPYAALDNLLPKSKAIDLWVRGDAMQHFVAGAAPMAPAAGAESAPKPLASSLVGQDAPLFDEYGFSKAVAQEYIKKDSPTNIVVQVNEMGGPEDGYGLFSVLAAGTGELVSGNWLAGVRGPGRIVFVKGRFVVMVQEKSSGLAATAAAPAAGSVADPLKAFADAVAGNVLAGTTAMSSMIDGLPRADMKAGSATLVRGPLGMARLQGLPAGVGMKMTAALGMDRPGAVTLVTATYESTGGAANTIFVAKYDTAQDAELAASRVSQMLMEGTPAERNTMAVTTARNYVVGTFNAEEESVQRVLPKVISDLGG